MPERILDIYLEDELRASAASGKHNYFNKIRLAFEGRGYALSFPENTPEARLASAARPGYSLFHMDEPTHDRALTTRRAYFYPFWRIEPTGRRWDWSIAKSAFRPAEIEADATNAFFGYWRRQLFGPVLDRVDAGGYVYVPLQGRLRDHRAFQSMSPLDMLEQTLAAEPNRRIVAALHPKEVYTTAERKALDRLVQRHARLELSDAGQEALLPGADYVVTMNSSVALSGFFLRKPAILFARIDFHHIAENVADLGVDAAFEKVTGGDRPFARYLYWFLQLNSINAGRPTAPDQILDSVRRHGWRV